MFILGVKVDDVSMNQSLEIVKGWLKNGKRKPQYHTVRGKHYITTPNLEIIKDAQKDKQFKKILNSADLAIPDSSRLLWLKKLTEGENILKRLLIFPLGIFPSILSERSKSNGLTHFDVVTGVDLMEALMLMASEKAFTVGLLGGEPGVAEKTRECLIKKYPKLKITLVTDGRRWNPPSIVKTDILFVALGHGKQEKWIAENLPKIPVKVAMGVGGAFDYLSGNVPRAPKWMRYIGMEWLFRLIVQPWRIKRQLGLVVFLVSLLFKKLT